MELSRRVQSVKPSATLSINARAKELKASGIEIVNFGVGEPDFPTPQHIKEAAQKAIDDNFTRYTPVGGIPELKDAIIEQFKTDYGVAYEPGEILVSCGGKHCIYNLAQAILNEDDEVIIPAPYWVSYPDIIRLAGGRSIIVQTKEEDGFKLRPEKLEEAITEKTKLLILNSPSNPTGSVYTLDELKSIAEILIKHRILVLTDDIYNKIIFGDAKWVSILHANPDMKELTMVLNGVSKTYSMTGWRIGYMAGPDPIISACTKIQSQSTSNPNSIAQVAAVAALNGPQDDVERMVSAFAKRREYFLERLQEVKYITFYPPQGAFYIFPNFSAYYGKKYDGQVITNSLDLTSFLMEEAEIALVPGSAFGDDRCLRFSFATSITTIEKGMDKLEAALNKLL